MPSTSSLSEPGLAAQATIDHLRRENYAGRITLVGDEALAPYDRPPLSKELLWAPEDPQPRPLATTPLDQQQVQYLAMTRAAHLDPDHQCVKLDSGEALSYDHLVIATGASARHLDPDPHQMAGVLTLRSFDDCRSLRTHLERRPRLVVIGAGFIGCEVAGGAARRRARAGRRPRPGGLGRRPQRGVAAQLRDRFGSRHSHQRALRDHRTTCVRRR